MSSPSIDISTRSPPPPPPELSLSPSSIMRPPPACLTPRTVVADAEVATIMARTTVKLQKFVKERLKELINIYFLETGKNLAEYSLPRIEVARFDSTEDHFQKTQIFINYAWKLCRATGEEALTLEAQVNIERNIQFARLHYFYGRNKSS